MHSLPFSLTNVLRNSKIFNDNLCNLTYQDGTPKSAVAIILKRRNVQQYQQNDSALTQDQILFLQRANSDMDSFSGGICFPGGRQQPDELLIDTAIREAFQQTNIQLKKGDLIGCIDRRVNLIRSSKTTNKNGKQLRQMGVYVFLFSIGNESKNIKLNEKEIQAYKWVDANQLMNPSNFCWLDYTGRIRKIYSFDSRITQNQNLWMQCIDRAYLPAINLGMKEKLYGLSLFITLVLLVNFAQQLSRILNEQLIFNSKQAVHIVKNKLCDLKEIGEKCSAKIVFSVNKPTTNEFRLFQNSLNNIIGQNRSKL